MTFHREIGNTPLFEVPQLSGELGAHVYVKDESRNPYGTFKDRRNYWLLMQDDHIESPVYYIQITSGNSGLSLVNLCNEYTKETGKERHVINFVSKDISHSVKRQLRKHGNIVKEVNLRKKIIPNHSLEYIGKELLKNEHAIVHVVEHMGSNGDGLGEIAAELDPVNPSYVALPIGEGEHFYKLWAGFRKTRSKPKLIGAFIPESVFAYGPDVDFVPDIGNSIADKLVTPYSDFKSLVLDICKRGDGDLVKVSDEEIEEMYKKLLKLDINSEPSAAAAFAGVYKYGKEHPFSPDDTIVIMNTGNGIYDTSGARRKAIKRAAIGALSLSVLFSGAYFLYERKIESIRNEKAQEYLAEYDTEQLEKNYPIMSEILAFSLMKGGMKEIDEKTKNYLTMYFICSDNITRDWFNNGRGGKFRQTVEEFTVWREKAKQTTKEHYTYTDR
ncbi:MAG: PLP-dependent lyase/thiolase [Candidatus Aenigmatarchaeota archaeon]